jgi:glycosyltransferase involved in cell wall biosynthesis
VVSAVSAAGGARSTLKLKARSRVKRAGARPIRAALVRYGRARPTLAETARGERRLFILLSTAWGMGGTIRTTLNLAGYLAQRYEVEIISIGRHRDRPFFGEFPPGVTVVSLEDRRRGAQPGGPRAMNRIFGRILRALPSVLMHPRDAAAQGFSLWIDVLLVRRLRRRPGFLIGTRPGFNLLAAELSPPGTITIGQEHMHLRHHHPALQEAMERLYPKLGGLTVLTEQDLHVYEEHFGGRIRLARIPNTVREMEGPKADLGATRVLAAGRLTRQKGYDLLIDAFARVAARHPGWRLRICGAGPERSNLEAMIAARGLQGAIELRGPARDLGAEMAHASLFVLSSRWEGLPLVLLEAMSKGMGIVSFDCPTGPADAISDHRNGILVAPADVEALAAGMLELIEDEDLRRRCAAAAVETARGYTIEAIGPRWEALLLELRRDRTAATAEVRDGHE